MNSSVIFGSLIGAAVAVLIFLIIRRLRHMKRYERLVRAHLGTSAVKAYNETTMIYIYDYN